MLALEKKPVPAVDQNPVPTELEPLSAAERPGHTEKLTPASTEGPFVNVMSILSRTCKQFPLPVELR